MYKRYFKRIFDVTLSLTGLICLSPVLLVLYVLVRVKLGSPVFFRQLRIGKNDKPFMMIKFRTMTDTRGEDGELLPDTE